MLNNDPRAAIRRITITTHQVVTLRICRLSRPSRLSPPSLLSLFSLRLRSSRGHKPSSRVPHIRSSRLRSRLRNRRLSRLSHGHPCRSRGIRSPDTSLHRRGRRSSRNPAIALPGRATSLSKCLRHNSGTRFRNRNSARLCRSRSLCNRRKGSRHISRTNRSNMRVRNRLRLCHNRSRRSSSSSGRRKRSRPHSSLRRGPRNSRQSSLRNRNRMMSQPIRSRIKRLVGRRSARQSSLPSWRSCSSSLVASATPPIA